MTSSIPSLAGAEMGHSMGLFDRIKEPVFLKETSSAALQLARLQELAAEAPFELRGRIEQEIKLLRAGRYGEETIAFELRNSHIPMMVLHDLYLECGELSAQIDYLIVTRKRIFLIECKNLIGDIEINNNGDFIRTVSYSGALVKEGIYSPITQSKRHLELLRQLRRGAKGNMISRAIFDKHFYENYRAVVVLANPKTVLNARYAKKEVKQQVLRADQLLEYIQRVNAEPDANPMSEQQMIALARFYLDLHRENTTDYTAKYRALISVSRVEVRQGDQTGAEDGPSTDEPAQIICPQCGAPMVKRTARKGANAGRPFYGCSRFPQCRAVIDASSRR